MILGGQTAPLGTIHQPHPSNRHNAVYLARCVVLRCCTESSWRRSLPNMHHPVLSELSVLGCTGGEEVLDWLSLRPTIQVWAITSLTLC